MELFFYLLATLTLLGALGAVLLKNLVHCALSLILFFAGIAGFYILLQAEFIAAVQILIYVGAVATLVLFAIMLTQNVIGETTLKGLGQNRWWALGISLVVITVLVRAIQHQTLPSFLPEGRVTTNEIGHTLVTTYVLPFEVISILLTGAMIGAIVVAMETKKNKQQATGDRRRT
ncbi:MAG: NADH-quinone oxidoreductase subunit J [Candidatus Omnitrophica bacterium]|nr:NADH-quinone oxidoreductase subunit J [Candidatus Omnitrophota bacterium]